MYDKFIKLKDRLEIELTALENHFTRNIVKRSISGPYRTVIATGSSSGLSGNANVGRTAFMPSPAQEPCMSMDKEPAAEVIQNKKDAFNVIVHQRLELEARQEKEKLEILARSQSIELDSLKAKLKDYESQIEIQKEKIQNKEENLTVFIANVSRKVTKLEKDKYMLESMYNEQNKNNTVLSDENRFFRSEIEKYQKKEKEYCEKNETVKNKLNENDKEITLLFSRVKNLENERIKLIDEIRKINLENVIKQQFKVHENKKSVFAKLYNWLASPLINLNTGKNGIR
ncbi:MAG: hypothetical protein LHV68_08865 [Elusimicrobia bacterium]|nr:hypothetical protein [Candidatus Liberimonas magnetica]